LISSIIPELRDDLSHCRQQYMKITNHNTLFPDPATSRESEERRVIEGKGTYVCHGSTREKKTASTLRIYRLERTKMWFPCGEPCELYCGWSRGPEVRAIFEVLFVTGSLRG
jgi:hypothetical protein